MCFCIQMEVPHLLCWGPQARWALKCSTSPMVLSIQMVLTKRTGSAATNVNTLTTWTVLHMKKKQNSTSPLSAPSMNVENSKRVTSPLKRVIKRVIFPFSVAKQKTTKKKRLGKDRRWISKRQKTSAGEGSKEQLWSVAEMDEVFDLREANQNKPPKEKLSKLAISKKQGFPILLCARGCLVIEEVAGGGRLQEARGSPKFSRQVSKQVILTDLQAGTYPLAGNLLYTSTCRTRNPLSINLDQETSLKEIVMLYARRGFPFTGKQVCVLAFEMASRDNNKGFSPVKKQAGRAWLRGFYKRNPEIRQKVSVNLSIARAIAANPTQIGKFFE